MSQQGPILVVSTAGRPSFAAALDEAKLFPVIETDWADAARAVEQVQPAAVLAAMSGRRRRRTSRRWRSRSRRASPICR